MSSSAEIGADPRERWASEDQRKHALTVACPQCGSGVGDACTQEGEVPGSAEVRGPHGCRISKAGRPTYTFKAAKHPRLGWWSAEEVTERSPDKAAEYYLSYHGIGEDGDETLEADGMVIAIRPGDDAALKAFEFEWKSDEQGPVLFFRVGVMVKFKVSVEVQK